MLGINTSTVRRRIKEGRLHAVKVERPQGYTLRVLLDATQPADELGDPASSTPTCAHMDVAGQDHVAGASSAQLAPADHQRAEAMAAYSTALIAPLVARLAEQETIIRDQAETVGSLRERLAAAEERLRSQDARYSPTASILTAEAEEPTTGGASDPPPEPRPSPMPPPIPSKPDGKPAAWWQRWWAALAGV